MRGDSGGREAVTDTLLRNTGAGVNQAAAGTTRTQKDPEAEARSGGEAKGTSGPTDEWTWCVLMPGRPGEKRGIPTKSTEQDLSVSGQTQA